MNKTKTGIGRNFLKTSAFATGSQLITLFSSLSLSLILPKFISIENYGNWQLFLLYSSYVGILHFGFNDGIYLKYGGQKLEDLNAKEIVPQYFLVFCLQIICALILSSFAYYFVNDQVRQEILYLLSAYLVIENCYKILGFTLMATDQMIYYSKTVVVDKIILLILVAGIISKVIPEQPTIIIKCFIGAHVFALGLIILRFRKLFHEWSGLFFRISLSKVISNMSFGIALTISNILGALIIGSGRFFVEQYWNIEMFAKISLAISISMFMLVFISQIGLVLFPLLRNIDIHRQKNVLKKGVFFLGIIVTVCYIFFFPIYFFVKNWLPNYSDSLVFLVFLFPISLYEIKFNLLYNTYFKTLNKQKTLFLINALTVAIAMVLYLAATYIDNIELVLIAMLFALMFRSIVSQIYLLKWFGLRPDSFFYFEILISFLFILCFKFFGIWGLLNFYLLVIIFISVIYHKSILTEYYYLKEKFV